jgi:hypothetical protein
MDLHHEAERLLRRYLVEVVEPFGLCPWARRARERGEVAIQVIDDPAETLGAVERILATAGAVMGMVVLPRARLDPLGLRRLRDEVVARRARVAPEIGIADFHPDGEPDFSSDARAIPGLRRTPDPTLQVVRLDVLAAARAVPPPPGLGSQAAILAGRAPDPAVPVSDQIARANRARCAGPDFAAAIAAIHADRDETYARLRASFPEPP